MLNAAVGLVLDANRMAGPCPAAHGAISKALSAHMDARKVCVSPTVESAAVRILCIAMTNFYAAIIKESPAIRCDGKTLVRCLDTITTAANLQPFPEITAEAKTRFPHWTPKDEVMHIMLQRFSYKALIPKQERPAGPIELLQEMYEGRHEQLHPFFVRKPTKECVHVFQWLLVSMLRHLVDIMHVARGEKVTLTWAAFSTHIRSLTVVATRELRTFLVVRAADDVIAEVGAYRAGNQLSTPRSAEFESESSSSSSSSSSEEEEEEEARQEESRPTVSSAPPVPTLEELRQRQARVGKTPRKHELPKHCEEEDSEMDGDDEEGGDTEKNGDDEGNGEKDSGGEKGVEGQEQAGTVEKRGPGQAGTGEKGGPGQEKAAGDEQEQAAVIHQHQSELDFDSLDAIAIDPATVEAMEEEFRQDPSLEGQMNELYTRVSPSHGDLVAQAVQGILEPSVHPYEEAPHYEQLLTPMSSYEVPCN